MTAPTTQYSASDFDFFIGTWSVAHRRLKERMVGCNEWIEFKGTSVARKMLLAFIVSCLLMARRAEGQRLVARHASVICTN